MNIKKGKDMQLTFTVEDTHRLNKQKNLILLVKQSKMKKTIKYIFLLSNQQSSVGKRVGGKISLIHSWWESELYISAGMFAVCVKSS